MNELAELRQEIKKKLNPEVRKRIEGQLREEDKHLLNLPDEEVIYWQRELSSLIYIIISIVQGCYCQRTRGRTFAERRRSKRKQEAIFPPKAASKIPRHRPTASKRIAQKNKRC